MKLKVTLLVFCLSIFSLTAQNRATPDVVKTNKGDLYIQPITHGSLVFSWDNKVVYVDPYGGADLYKGLMPPDIILITDIHGDHLNKNTLNALNTSKAILYVPQAVYEQLDSKMKSKAKVITNGESMSVSGMNVEAIPMYNLPESSDAFHTKGRGNGYVVTFSNKRVYISGDTEDIPEMRKLNKIDVAFVCMNLPYTMDIEAAASAVLDFKPKVVYPYHYRGTEGLSDIDTFKNMVNKEDKAINVKIKDWYPTN